MIRVELKVEPTTIDTDAYPDPPPGEAHGLTDQVAIVHVVGPGAGRTVSVGLAVKSLDDEADDPTDPLEAIDHAVNMLGVALPAAWELLAMQISTNGATR